MKSNFFCSPDAEDLLHDVTHRHMTRYIRSLADAGLVDYAMSNEMKQNCSISSLRCDLCEYDRADQYHDTRTKRMRHKVIFWIMNWIRSDVTPVCVCTRFQCILQHVHRVRIRMHVAAADASTPHVDATKKVQCTIENDVLIVIRQRVMSSERYIRMRVTLAHFHASADFCVSLFLLRIHVYNGCCREPECARRNCRLVFTVSIHSCVHISTEKISKRRRRKNWNRIVWIHFVCHAC